MTTPPANATPVTPVIVGEMTVSLKDYADQHGIHPRTVKRWLADDELPGAYQDENNHWRIPIRAIRTPKSAASTGNVITLGAQPTETRKAVTAAAPMATAIKNYDALPTMLPVEIACELIGVTSHAIHANQDYYGAVKHGRKGALVVPLATVKRLRGL